MEKVSSVQIACLGMHTDFEAMVTVIQPTNLVSGSRLEKLKHYCSFNLKSRGKTNFVTITDFKVCDKEIEERPDGFKMCECGYLYMMKNSLEMQLSLIHAMKGCLFPELYSGSCLFPHTDVTQTICLSKKTIALINWIQVMQPTYSVAQSAILGLSLPNISASECTLGISLALSHAQKQLENLNTLAVLGPKMIGS